MTPRATLAGSIASLFCSRAFAAMMTIASGFSPSPLARSFVDSRSAGLVRAQMIVCD
jgi:hypothetical protein